MLVERVVESLGVAAGIERENAGVDAAAAQLRQQRQEVLFGAADPFDLDDVQDLHRERTPAYTRSTSSTMRDVENLSRIRSAPGAAQLSASRTVVLQLAQARSEVGDGTNRND